MEKAIVIDGPPPRNVCSFCHEAKLVVTIPVQEIRHERAICGLCAARAIALIVRHAVDTGRETSFLAAAEGLIPATQGLWRERGKRLRDLILPIVGQLPGPVSGTLALALAKELEQPWWTYDG